MALPPEAFAVSLPSRRLQLLPAGAKIAGRDLHPLGNCAFPRRTENIHLAVSERTELQKDFRIGQNLIHDTCPYRKLYPTGAKPRIGRCSVSWGIC